MQKKWSGASESATYLGGLSPYCHVADTIREFFTNSFLSYRLHRQGRVKGIRVK